MRASRGRERIEFYVLNWWMHESFMVAMAEVINLLEIYQHGKPERSWLEHCNRLQVFDLSHNGLSGKIPNNWTRCESSGWVSPIWKERDTDMGMGTARATDFGPVKEFVQRQHIRQHDCPRWNEQHSEWPHLNRFRCDSFKQLTISLIER